MNEREPESDRAGRPTRPPVDPRRWPAWARSFPGGHLLALRAFLGVTFCFAGLQKLSNRAFFENGNPASIQSQLQASALTTPVGHLLHPLVHVAVLVGVLVALGELAVGIGTLLGLWSRLAGVGGMLLALMFFLTVSYNTSPYYYGPDIVFFFAWTVLALNGAGALSLDAYFAGRRRRASSGTEDQVVLGPAGVGGTAPDLLLRPAAGGPIGRRAAMGKLAATSLVGGATLALGAVAAAVGRRLSHAGTTVTGSTFPPSPGGSATPSTTEGASGTTSTTDTARSAPRGKRLGPASAVAVGGGVGFTDPFQGIPAYVVQPEAGEFRGFSAVCTHAGCTVAFVQSAEQFQCPCHGSIYSAATGAVLGGPAPRPLPPIGIELSGGELYVTD